MKSQQSYILLNSIVPCLHIQIQPWRSRSNCSCEAVLGYSHTCEVKHLQVFASQSVPFYTTNVVKRNSSDSGGAADSHPGLMSFIQECTAFLPLPTYWDNVPHYWLCSKFTYKVNTTQMVQIMCNYTKMQNLCYLQLSNKSGLSFMSWFIFFYSYVIQICFIHMWFRSVLFVVLNPIQAWLCACILSLNRNITIYSHSHAFWLKSSL